MKKLCINLLTVFLLIWSIHQTQAIILISPDTCAASGTYYPDKCLLNPALCVPYTLIWNCTIAKVAIDIPALTFESAVPLRTTILRQCAVTTPPEWTCSNPAYLDLCAMESKAYLDRFNGMLLHVTYDSLYTTGLALYFQDAFILRRTDKKPITSIVLEDVNPTLTIQATFRSNCELAISFNTPDVDSKEQAQQLFSDIQKDAARAVSERDAYQQLIVFSQAYAFVKAIVDNFYNQLSNDTIQNLRTLCATNKDTLKALITDTQGPYTQDQRLLLFNLYLSMFNLGDAKDWQNPDGTTKTIEQYLGSASTGMFDAIKAIGDKVKTYDEAYKKAAQEAETLASKVALAQVQLAAWLQ